MRIHCPVCRMLVDTEGDCNGARTLVEHPTSPNGKTRCRNSLAALVPQGLARNVSGVSATAGSGETSKDSLMTPPNKRN